MNASRRFAIFVDGSNLIGDLRTLNLHVGDYEQFFSYLFKQSVEAWKCCFHDTSLPAVELRRVYWYALGHIDDWDLSNTEALKFLREQFEKDKVGYKDAISNAGKTNPGKSQSAIAEAAWQAYIADRRSWYDSKKDQIASMKRFYHGIRRDTDFIDVRDVAHWKVNFADRRVDEKGLDTALAVDMVALEQNYDVAILISGDADNLPGINYIKEHNKTVGLVEFLKGHPPEKRGRNTSNRLKLQADFIVQIYETDLTKQKVASTPQPTITTFKK
jgi:uncharacterized LabA/DUF88 family protein